MSKQTELYIARQTAQRRIEQTKAKLSNLPEVEKTITIPADDMADVIELLGDCRNLLVGTR